MSRDLGHTAERARDGLNAATALVVGAKPGERKAWLKSEAHWSEQLRYAEKAGR